MARATWLQSKTKRYRAEKRNTDDERNRSIDKIDG